MRVVFLFFLNFLSFGLALNAQIVINGEDGGGSRLIECGTTENFSTEGQGNTYSNYTFLEGADAYEGEDVLYRFVIDEESDVRLTIESDCPKLTTLFFINNEGNTETIALSELSEEVNKDFLGAVRLYEGEYFFLIDEKTENGCKDFTILLECTPFSPFKICQYGGNVTSCGKTIRDTLSRIQDRIIPFGKAPDAPAPPNNNNFDIQLAPGDTCVPKYFEVYQAYFKNPQEIVATITDKTGNSSVQILSEDCACVIDVYCFSGECSSESDTSQSILADVGEGFYYIVVSGDSAATYDLKVTTEDCNCNYETIPIECGQTVTENAADFNNDFFNNQSFGLNHYDDCYNGNRPYNGGDVIYQFEVSTTTEVTINLKSFFEAGLFLFDANCKDQCLTYEETTGINGGASISKFRLNCGVYQIVVDLSRPHPASIDCPFTLDLFCEDIQAIQILGDKAPNPLKHDIEIKETILTTNNVPLKSNTGDVLNFSTFIANCKVEKSILAIVYTGNNEGTLAGENPTINKSCYFQNDEILLTHTKNGNVLDIDWIPSGAITPRYKDQTKNLIVEISSSVVQGKPAPIFTTNPLDKRVPANPSSTPYKFQVFTSENSNINEKERWCIREDAMMPSENPIEVRTDEILITGAGTESVELDIADNNTISTRTLNLVLTYYDPSKKDNIIRIRLTQRGSLAPDCNPDRKEPTINNCRELDTIEINRAINDIDDLYNYLLQAIGDDLTYSDLCGSVSDPSITGTTFDEDFSLENGQIDTIKWTIFDEAEVPNANTCEIYTKAVLPIPQIPTNPFFEEYPWTLDEPIAFEEQACQQGDTILIYERISTIEQREYYAFLKPENIVYLYNEGDPNATFQCQSHPQADCFEIYIGRNNLPLVATFACKNTREKFSPVIKSTLEKKKTKLKVYPNPNHGAFTLEVPEKYQKSTLDEIRVFDTFGKIVKILTIAPVSTSDIIPLDLQELSNGVYYLQASFDNDIQIAKFIISKN